MDNFQNKYQCKCRHWYGGENCDFLNPCHSNPCQNGGKCVKIHWYKYKCICPRQYLGITCSEKNPCYSNPCQNYGACSIVKKYYNYLYKCQCLYNYKGNNCQFYIPHGQVNHMLSRSCGGTARVIFLNGFGYERQWGSWSTCPSRSGNYLDAYGSIGAILCDYGPVRHSSMAVSDPHKNVIWEYSDGKFAFPTSVVYVWFIVDLGEIKKFNLISFFNTFYYEPIHYKTSLISIQWSKLKPPENFSFRFPWKPKFKMYSVRYNKKFTSSYGMYSFSKRLQQVEEARYIYVSLQAGVRQNGLGLRSIKVLYVP